MIVKFDSLQYRSRYSPNGIIAGVLVCTNFSKPRETLAKSNRKPVELVTAIGVRFYDY